MVNKVLNEYDQIAIEAINKIESPAYYKVEYRNKDVDDLSSFLITLNCEQLVEVQVILAECNTKGIALEEYFKENPIPQYLSKKEYAFYQAPESISLEKEFYKCRVKIALFNDCIEKGSDVEDIHIMLSRDDYTSLLGWQLANRKSSYNDLYNDRPELFGIVNDAVRNFFSVYYTYTCTLPTYALELTEIKQMAFDICGEPALDEEIFAPDGGIMEHSHLHIENRVLSFFYEKFVARDYECILDEYVYIDDVDAIAVQNALGMSNNKGVLYEFIERFGDNDGVRNFKAFLIQNDIEFTIKE